MAAFDSEQPLIKEFYGRFSNIEIIDAQAELEVEFQRIEEIFELLVHNQEARDAKPFTIIVDKADSPPADSKLVEPQSFERSANDFRISGHIQRVKNHPSKEFTDILLESTI